ncbi:MAG: galactose-1-phosphate uridylyltransferase [Nitrospirota bacterium]
MPEIRLNLVTREWVIIATERAKRPEDFKKAVVRKKLPLYSETCPFCPGNESKTPDEIYRIQGKDGWEIRVVPNKFAALSRKGERTRKTDGLKRLVAGVGTHEVLIETPLHNMTIALLPVEQVEKIIRAYKQRFLEIHDDTRIEHVIIFKNHGEGAGTSLEHPHSQIIGTPVTPFQVRYRIEEMVRYFDNTGECLICKTLAEEMKDRVRIIYETKHFVTFIPYAALSAFHTWIFPKRHTTSFGMITDEEIKDLAINLKITLAKFYYGLDNPDFNYVIRSNSPKEPQTEYYHWYLSIVPRLSMAAGFELGSGMYINTSLPEDSAKFLREITHA